MTDRREFLGAVAGVAAAAVLPPAQPECVEMLIPVAGKWVPSGYMIYTSRKTYEQLTALAEEGKDADQRTIRPST
jgi:hypothetical protein